MWTMGTMGTMRTLRWGCCCCDWDIRLRCAAAADHGTSAFHFRRRSTPLEMPFSRLGNGALEAEIFHLGRRSSVLEAVLLKSRRARLAKNCRGAALVEKANGGKRKVLARARARKRSSGR